MNREQDLNYIRDMCDVLVTSHPFFYINTHSEDRVFASWQQSSSAMDEAMTRND